jgi:hypothetical protein
MCGASSGCITHSKDTTKILYLESIHHNLREIARYICHRVAKSL